MTLDYRPHRLAIPARPGLEISRVSKKALPSTLLVFTLIVSLAGCGQKEAPAEAAPAEAATADAPAMPHPMPSQTPAEVDLSGIARAEGGKTVAEIFAEKDQLSGQPVTFRGKVVKANANIMGKNWLHVRDGTGAEGENDLTVTTAALPEIGDTVLVSGTVALGQDFGMGYQYDILIEDATVEVEATASL